MEDITRLIVAAQAAPAERNGAFTEIVRRYQDLAFGAAYAVLGDLHLAEDTAQEAFMVAWRNLDQLRQPAAFPGWFKRIVLSQCHRLTRARRLDFVGLDLVADVPAPGADPAEIYADQVRRDAVHAAIQALPEHERLVTRLFYSAEASQKDIAVSLGLPLTTVKKRLFSARGRLHARMGDSDINDSHQIGASTYGAQRKRQL